MENTICSIKCIYPQGKKILDKVVVLDYYICYTMNLELELGMKGFLLSIANSKIFPATLQTFFFKKAYTINT